MKCQAAIVFDAGKLYLRVEGYGTDIQSGNGSGELLFQEDVVTIDDSEDDDIRRFRIRVPSDDILFLRDKLNEYLPPEAPALHAQAGAEEQGLDRAIRDQRQAAIYAWIERAFGGVEGVDFPSIDERGRRFLEEAVELFQAVRSDGENARAHAHRVIDYVFDRAPGTTHQEIGGVMVTLNGLAQVLGHSVAEEEEREFARVLAKPIEHFQRRQAAKRDAEI